MEKNKNKPLNNVKCDICGYQNHMYWVKRSGICHLCGKILDDRAYFKSQLSNKLGLKDKRWKRNHER